MFSYKMIVLVLVFILFTSLQIEVTLADGDVECKPVKFNYSSVACVCTADHCDVSYPSVPTSGEFVAIVSNMAGLRFKKDKGSVAKIAEQDYQDNCFELKLDVNRQRLVLRVNRSDEQQDMLGFGGSFSDSAGFMVSQLSDEMQDVFMKSLYSEAGLAYSLGRVPIGGADFSLRAYSYDDDCENDTALECFALQCEDYLYKIPFIQKAKELASDELLLSAAAWSPPVWMKNVPQFTGKNHLKPEYYETYAQYHIKFLEAYSESNITFWSISPGNEPTNGLYTIVSLINNLGWSPDDMGRFIGYNLGPALKNSKFNTTKLFILDDSRHATILYLNTILSIESAITYMDGLALHGYVDSIVTGDLVDVFKQTYPDLPVVTTEYCDGASDTVKVQKGSWARAQNYATTIMDEIQHHSSAFIDWNMALNLTGGPCYSGNAADALILIDPENQRFYKQPSYYAMGHFSKYVPRGSRRIGSAELSRSEVGSVAFLRPDGRVAVVLHNSNNVTVYTTIVDEAAGQVDLELTPSSITTVVY